MSPEDTLRTRASLLLRLKRPDDLSAWTEFVETYGPVIVGWCQRRGLQTADAEDVAQTILLRLAHRMKAFDYDPGLGTFRAYLRTLAKYAVSDFYSKDAERGSGDTRVLASLESVAAREDLLARLDQSFDRELLGEAVSRVRRRVEPLTWQAFELTAMQGMTAADTAARLSSSLASVYKSKSRVLQALREELAQLDSNQDSLARVQDLLCDS